MADKSLVIGGVKMPTPKLNGLKITKNKVWSSNTGRTADATMVGDLIGYKYKLQITWPPLTDAQAVLVDAAVSPAFFDVSFWDPATNSRVTKTFYAGDPTYPVYSYVDGIKSYQGVAVDLIQQ